MAIALRTTVDRVALLKVETTYGTDPTPAAANVILLMNTTIAPSADKLERDIDRPWFGGNPFVLVGKKIELDAETDLIGNLTAGLAAPLGVLYRICQHTETLVTTALATPVAPTCTTSATGGTLPAATQSYRVAAYNQVGETLASTAGTVVTTGATSTATVTWITTAGAIGYRVYGRTGGSELFLADVAAPNLSWVDTGANVPLGPVRATNVTLGTAYSPVSKAIASGTVYFFQAGVFYKMTGVRGYMDFDFSIKQFAKAKVKLTGLLTIPADGDAPAGIDWSVFTTPAAIETESWEVRVGGVNVNAQMLSLSCNAAIKLQEGSESREVTVTDRVPTGTLSVFKDQLLTTWNPWAIADAQQIVTLFNEVVKSNGRNVSVPMRVQLEYPKPKDIDGVLGYEIPFTAIPSGLGGDEYQLAFPK